MNKHQIRKLVVETLQEIELYTPESANLLLGTMAQESHLGHYIEQINGPAVGIFQMEPATYRDIWNNYLEYKKVLALKILKLSVTADTSDEMRWNLKLAIAMCRVHYLRDKEPIPFSLEGQANYYKRVYNTYKGKATIKEYIDNYNKYVL